MKKRILVVDDDPDFRRLLERVLDRDYQTVFASSGEEALEKVGDFTPDMALLDIMLPEMNGHELCRRLKSSRFGERLPVIMITAVTSPQEHLEAFKSGADDCLVKPISPGDLRSRLRLHLELRDASIDLAPMAAANQRFSSELEEQVARKAEEIMTQQRASVCSLTMLANSREVDGGERLVRIRYYAPIIAAELGKKKSHAGRVDGQFVKRLYRGAPLHDIGKVGIRDSILIKRDPLTPAESEVMKQHTVVGGVLLEQAASNPTTHDFLATATVLARSHHERFDGSGYPDGLAGEEIPLAARILAVADRFEELTEAVADRPPGSVNDAATIIEGESRTGFDPSVVDAFLACLGELAAVRRQLSDGNPTTVGAISFLE
jgi:putative two-component system response regulator